MTLRFVALLSRFCSGFVAARRTLDKLLQMGSPHGETTLIARFVASPLSPLKLAFVADRAGS